MSGGTRVKSSGVLHRLLHRSTPAADLVEAKLNAGGELDDGSGPDGLLALADSADLLTGVLERHEMLLFNQVFEPFKLRVPPSAEARRHAASSGASSASREAPSSPTARRSKQRPADAPANPASDAASSSGLSAATLERMPPREPILGRDKLLRRMNKLFSERSEKQIKLYGPEGAGKTCVAVEFAHLYNSLFPGGVVWLNGGSIVWDAHQFLVQELGQAALSEEMETPALRERLWHALNANAARWLLVIDDATEDVLAWVPPPPLAQGGCVLLTCKAKSGPDEALRVELPLLSAKSAADIVRDAAAAAPFIESGNTSSGVGGRRASTRRKSAPRPALSMSEQSAMSALTDTTHLCRNALALRVAGTVMGLYNLSCEEMLARYDALAAKTLMPDLVEVLERYKLRPHLPELRNMGVIDTNDFVRGRPWTSLEGLSRKETHLFEKIQEHLFRSRNRLSAKLVCKIWRKALNDPAVKRGRLLWEVLRTASFLGPRDVPAALLAADLAAAGFVDPQSQPSQPPTVGDVLWRAAGDGSFSVHASLQEAVRGVLLKPSEQNRALARRVLESMHGYCAQHLFPAEHLAVASGQHFRSVTMRMLPHIFMAVGLCGDLLAPTSGKPGPLEDAGDLSLLGLRHRSRQAEPTSGGGAARGIRAPNSAQRAMADELPEDFVVSRLPRRHSLFSVASGASSVSARSRSGHFGDGSSRSLRGASRSSAADSSGSAAELGEPVVAAAAGRKKTTAATGGSGGAQMLKQLSRRLTSRGKRSSEPDLMLADLNMLQAFLLLLTPLGQFRFAQASKYLRAAMATYTKLDDRAQLRAAKYLSAHCLLRNGQTRGAGALWAEVSDLASDKVQRAFAKGALALAYGLQHKSSKAASIAAEAIALHTGGGAAGSARRGSSNGSASPGSAAQQQQHGSARVLVAARNRTVLAHLLTTEDRDDEAASALRAALDAYEDVCPLSMVCAETHKLLAAALLRLGDAAEAQQHTEEAATIFSSGLGYAERHIAEVWTAEARALQAQGDARGAVAALCKSLAHSDTLYGELAATRENATRLAALSDAGAKGKRVSAEYLSQVKRVQKELKQWDALFARYASAGARD